jgi:hypothetical protein
LTPQQLDQIGLVAGAIFTLAIFSYLLADNFLYRIAIHMFIGAAAAFVLITAVESVLLPWVTAYLLAQPIDPPRFIYGLLPFLVGYLLLLKLSPRFSRIGTLGLAIVVSVGAAVALWGAVVGTLIPFVTETARGFRPDNILDGLIILTGTVCVLIYFTFLGTRRAGGQVEQALPVRFLGRVGQAFITLTLGATYALLIISTLSILTGVFAERFSVLLPGR